MVPTTKGTKSNGTPPNTGLHPDIFTRWGKNWFSNSSWSNAQNMLFETCKGFGQLHKDC